MVGSNDDLSDVKEGHDSPRYATPAWVNDIRAEEKTKILKTACLLADDTPNGIPFPKLLNTVFGDEWEPHDSNYMLAYRLLENYPSLLEKHKPMGDMLWVRPTAEAVSLLRSMQSVGNIDSDAVRELRLDEPPRNRAKRFLSNVKRVSSDRQRGLALKLLAYHRGTMRNEDGSPKWVAVGKPGTEERARVRVTDRFTDSERAARPRSTYEDLCDSIEASYDVATWVTYTAPRECIPSVYDSVALLRDALRTLHHDRFTYDPVSDSMPDRPGYVPPHLTVLEPHRDMVAHIHVVYAGERRLMDAHDLRRDWGDVLDAPPGKPPRIHLATLTLGSDRWRVMSAEGSDKGLQSYADIRDYHREPFRRLAEIADTSHEKLHSRADALLSGDGTDWDRDLASLALPWATEANFTSASPALRT